MTFDRSYTKKISCCLYLLLTAIAFSGCGSYFPYPAAVPSVHQPISASNVKNISPEFHKIFCSIVAQNTEWQSHPCNDFFLDFTNATYKRVEKIIEEIILKNDLRILLIPGIFGECLIKEVAPFEFAIQSIMEKYKNVRIETLNQISGRASSQFNANIIEKYINKLILGENEKLIIIGYSKGATDSLYYLANSTEKSKNKVDAFVSIAGTINGTQIADKAGYFGQYLGGNLPLDNCPTQDSSGISSLQISRQFEWLSQNAYLFKSNIKFFSLVTSSDHKSTSKVFKLTHKYLLKTGGINDGQVNAANQVIPNSYLLGHMKADHWAIALPFVKKKNSELATINKIIKYLATKNAFPREALLESIVIILDSNL